MGLGIRRGEANCGSRIAEGTVKTAANSATPLVDVAALLPQLSASERVFAVARSRPSHHWVLLWPECGLAQRAMSNVSVSAE
jgi:hypothetical protein